MSKLSLIESIIKTSSKLTSLLGKIEDEQLTIEEQERISKAYDIMTVHGSII
jgi:hypothetical protein